MLELPVKNLLLLTPDRLLAHPNNMRRFYPAEDVREMANSIAAAGGVLHPLVVAKAEAAGKYVVIDGNMRLAAARLLGAKCPALECKVVEQSEARQLTSMVVANKVRYDVDPVSEGLHFKLLRDQGLSVRDISKRTGVYEARITNRLVLADLDAPIQKLVTEGKLPHDHRVARALLSLEPKKRVKLAERLAQNPSTKISTILTACDRLAARGGPKKLLKRPAVELSGAEVGGSAAAHELRSSAARTCRSCSQYEGKLAKNPEPAWSLVVHAADETCNRCALKDIQNVCGSCPMVELLRKLVGARAGANGRH